MRIIVTRPLEDADETAKLLAARGYQALVAPLLATQFQDGPELSLDGVQAVLATSANGVRALARRVTRRDVPVFAVGPQTAEAADAAGFVTVRNANGDARALAKAALQWADPAKGALLHARGADGPGTMAAQLREDGFTVREETLYAVTPQPLEPEAIAALAAGNLDAALFYSPRSAAIFCSYAAQHNLRTDGLMAVCISPATAAALTLAFAQIRVAAAPNQTALLALLD